MIGLVFVRWIINIFLLYQELTGLHALVIPGGESTVIIKLLIEFGMFDSVQRFGQEVSYSSRSHLIRLMFLYLGISNVRYMCWVYPFVKVYRRYAGSEDSAAG